MSGLSQVTEALFVRNGKALRFIYHDLGQVIYQSAYERALLNLSHFVNHEHKWWSRAKVYSTALITPAMWGLMKVAGKRLYHVDLKELDALWSQIDPQNQRVINLSNTQALVPFREAPSIKPFTSLAEAHIWLSRWVAKVNKKRLETGVGEAHAEGRRWSGAYRTVGAIALDHELNIIASSLNHPQLNHTAHAERLILDTVCNENSSPHPKIHLISSLKPCKMCAGLWVTYAPTEQLHISYLKDDPGANGQHTAFDQESYAWRAANFWRTSFTSLSQVKVEG